MSKIKVGINGFGRIGRLAFRVAQERADIQVVAINDLIDVDYMAYMLKYDSTHGLFKGTVEVKDGHLIVNGNQIRVTAEKSPASLKWGEVGADYVIESTGIFLTKDSAQGHIDAGAKKVIMSAPSKDDTRCLSWVSTKDLILLTWFSFPMLLVPPTVLRLSQRFLNDNWGIEEGLMTTVHAMTATQKTVDGPSAKDWRGGRGAGQNIIPSSTGAAKAGVYLLLTLRFVHKMKEASETTMKGVLGYTEDAVVSNDFLGDPRTSSLMPKQSFLGYDNEWGYSNKVVDC
ncbi:unmed protein product [Daphnia sinensis]|uniref:Unmed protein product n=1 Tax=Daphnia sinensis TaxID=1820382 RepID=A0AAD5KD90_9CRUS|nr:unmed protein product [Daphnia sinensis]